jgi:hypothetical protein
MKIEKTTLEDILVSEGTITYTVIGKSMEPMLRQNHDIVTIIKKEPNVRCSENDVVLFKKKQKLVLHRIIEVLPDGRYNILGDNCAMKEKDVKEEDVIGIMTSFSRDGMKYYVTDDRYNNYIKRLRKNENLRMRKKYIYDALVWSLRFLPNKFLVSIKTVARRVIIFQERFE